MTSYKHTQIGYLMLSILVVITSIFGWTYIESLAEAPTYNSGPNLLIMATMVLTILVLASFATLTVSIDNTWLKIKFGYGVFQKKILLQEITSATAVQNRWYYGWGIRWRPWPSMWIYNVSGLKAVEITTSDGQVCRIGTDDQAGLQSAIAKLIHKSKIAKT